MKKKKKHNTTLSNENKIIETETKSIPLTHIQDCSLSWLGIRHFNKN